MAATYWAKWWRLYVDTPPGPYRKVSVAHRCACGEVHVVVVYSPTVSALWYGCLEGKCARIDYDAVLTHAAIQHQLEA